MLTETTFNAGKQTSATQGSVAVPFSALFADTLATHGYEFTFEFYVHKNGMHHNEFCFWFNAGWIPEEVAA